MRAHEILNNPFLNKGTAFTMKERQELVIVFSSTNCSNN
ncbi:Malolactic enzyme [Lactococcus lactis]|nr:Malolactic enzyme [Lactococcus lactis]